MPDDGIYLRLASYSEVMCFDGISIRSLMPTQALGCLLPKGWAQGVNAP